MSAQLYNKRWVIGCLTAALVAGATAARADEAALLQKIDALEKRLAEVEGKSTQMVMQASIPSKTLDFLGQTEISGFVSASFINSFSNSSKGGTPATIAGRGFDSNNDAFTINKFKLVLEKPIDYHPDKWDAGYRADLVFGQDAPIIQSNGGTFNLGHDGDLEQAFVDLNIPIGNGLKIIFGKTVTLMGLEVIEEVANPNWSVGNQFLYVENFTQTGLQLAYKWNDKLDTEFVVFNGWDQVTESNTAKSFMARIGYALNPTTSIGLLGFAGCEPQGSYVNNTNWRDGVELLLNHKWTDKLNTWLQLDYGHESNAPLADGSGTTTAHADWVAIGTWVTYDFTDKVGLAFRHDYLKDKDGVRTPNLGSSSAIVTTPATFSEAPKELQSFTLTLNYKPMPNVQVRPELRWDHSEAGGAFNGESDQFTMGVGVAYLY